MKEFYTFAFQTVCVCDQFGNSCTTFARNERVNFTSIHIFVVWFLFYDDAILDGTFSDDVHIMLMEAMLSKHVTKKK